MINDYYWLKNAHIPTCLMKDSEGIIPQTRENLFLADIKIKGDKIAEIIPSSPDTVGIDLRQGIVLPCFVDIHTHLDKAYSGVRSPNLQGDFMTALETIHQDKVYWDEQDLYQRMNFALQCSYCHGTIALRTHLDSEGERGDLSLRIWQQLKKEWEGKINLQAVSLVGLDYFLTEEGEKLADKIAEVGGILGGVAYRNGEIEKQLERVFLLAEERNLDLDFHADENGDMDSICLQKIAETALKSNFSHNILCGHCCSLAVQPPETVAKTIKLVKEANIAIVSLPLCNLYLQDRKKDKTPFWRGVTAVKELKQAGIDIAFASDNCQDAFFAFGDHDMLEVFNQSVRIAHLDTPYRDWIASVTKIPANLMKMPEFGQLGVNRGADFIVFSARYFSELLSRPQCDAFGTLCARTIIRKGKIIKYKLPDFSLLSSHPIIP